MARYFTKPVMWTEHDPEGEPRPTSGPLTPSPQVFPSEPTNTGLLDQDGKAIFKSADAVGFLRRR